MNYLYPFGHLAIAIIELILLAFAYPFFRFSGNSAMIVLPIVLVATIYDNLILWSGVFIGEGALLEHLSQARYLLHYLVIPLFIIVAIELAYLSEAKWANQFVRISSWLLALGLAGFDVVNNFIGLALTPETFAGMLRYVPVTTNIPVITIIVNIFVLLVGIGIWVRTKNWFWLFVGALISLMGNALPAIQVGTLPGSASECFLALSLLLTQYDFEDELEAKEAEEAALTSVSPPPGWHLAEYSGYQIFWKEKDGYRVYQTGSHRNGDFVRIYAPKTPKQQDNRVKVITYLHGFALCLPKFYKQHLEELAKQGYYVFFPDYQRSDYPDFTTDDQTYLDNPQSNRATLKFWLFNIGVLLIKLILRRKIEKQDLKEVADKGIGRALQLFFGTLLFIIGVNIIYLFNRQYGKNLISMIVTVLASLVDSPLEWLAFAVNTTASGWEQLSKYSREDDNPELDLSEKEIDFYVFGHSLGGLLALSWPYYLNQHSEPNLAKFHPQQILTADPAPNTAMGIPKIALWILGIFRFPFATQPLKIQETGKALQVTVGILHGNDDKIVKPTEWVKPPRTQQKGSFFDIASQNKNVYFSQSNRTKELTANHNQSVTDSTYYGNGFMENFGGAKESPNAYNFQYIWPALTAIVEEQVKANDLKNHQGYVLQDIDVLDEPQ